MQWLVGADQSIDWRQGDLRDPGVEGRFDLVLCVVNTLQHLLGDEDLLTAFVAARNLLAPGGRYAFDIYRRTTTACVSRVGTSWRAPSPTARGGTSRCAKTGATTHAAACSTSTGGLVRAQAPHLEPLATTRFRLRQHYPADVERLLARAGLRIASRHGDFDRSPLRAYPVWARGESGAICFLEGDEAAAELEEGEVVLFFLRPADQDATVAVEPGVSRFHDPASCFPAWRARAGRPQ